MTPDERISRALDSLTNRANTAEAEVKRLEAALAEAQKDRCDWDCSYCHEGEEDE